jgi:DNA uptake protein ComE-like DNA-binding protein
MGDRTYRHHRTHGGRQTSNRVVDLNTASEDEIARLPMVGRDRARALIQNRPFQDWDEIARLSGLGKGMILYLKSGGAQIGGTGA